MKLFHSNKTYEELLQDMQKDGYSQNYMSCRYRQAGTGALKKAHRGHEAIAGYHTKKLDKLFGNTSRTVVRLLRSVV